MRYQGGGIGHGDLGPPFDQTSFSSQRHSGQEIFGAADSDATIEQDRVHANNPNENNVGGGVDSDGSGGEDADVDEDNPDEWTLNGEICEDELYEDGEGQWNDGSPEADGYGSF